MLKALSSVKLVKRKLPQAVLDPRFKSSFGHFYKKERPLWSLFSIEYTHIDLSWNALELVSPNVWKAYGLGWLYYNGAVHIVEPATKKGNCHETTNTKGRRPSENVQVRRHLDSETSQLTDLDGGIHD